MKAVSKIMLLMAALTTAWGCSSDDDKLESQPTEISAGTDVRPAWQAPNYDLFEQTMTVDVILQDGLKSYASSADLLCAKVGEEVRGVALPNEVNGQWIYSIMVASNASGESINLYYYCDKLHRIFSTYWTLFDANMPPTGSGGIYQPVFVELTKFGRR
jgi:hypothetical protein